MKQWICKVCGYVHTGDEPPESCPICGVGPEEFELKESQPATKRWKCTVCDYVHTGDEPPEACPVCGVGPENFELDEAQPELKESQPATRSWKCTVCDYVHTGDEPPEACPVCGVGPENFELIEAQPAPKRWKCTVCDYVHTGDEPPEVCPVCGKGRDAFILLLDELQELTADAIATATDGTINSALDAVSYGLYVVASKNDDKINGQTSNTVFQLTATPPQIAVCLNKNTLTHEYVSASGVLTVSILDQSQSDMVKRFGYQSGRTVDKFQNTPYYTAKNGCPILADCLSYLEASVIPEKTTDVGTHTLFVAQVTSGRLVSSSPAMTYAYFRSKK